MLPIIKSILERNSLKVLPVSIRAEVKTVNDLDILHNEHLDNLYLKISQDLLEATMYDLIPWYIKKEDDVIFKIIAATRIRRKTPQVWDTKKRRWKEEKYEIAEQLVLKNDYGIDVKFSEYYAALQPTSFIPIAANVVFKRRESNKNLKIKGAKGISLEYEYSSCCVDKDCKDKYERNKRQLYASNNDCFCNIRRTHYISDLLANSEYVSINHPHRRIFRKDFPDGTADFYGDAFRVALDASRFIDDEDIVSALLCSIYVMANDSKEYADSIIPIILRRVADKIPDLSDRQFSEFIHLLRIYSNETIKTPPRKPSTEKSLTSKNMPALPEVVKVSQCEHELDEQEIKVVKLQGNYFPCKLFCENDNSEEIIISSNQVLKAKLSRSMISPGIRIKATISRKSDGKFYGREVRIIK